MERRIGADVGAHSATVLRCRRCRRFHDASNALVGRSKPAVTQSYLLIVTNTISAVVDVIEIAEKRDSQYETRPKGPRDALVALFQPKRPLRLRSADWSSESDRRGPIPSKITMPLDDDYLRPRDGFSFVFRSFFFLITRTRASRIFLIT